MERIIYDSAKIILFFALFITSNLFCNNFIISFLIPILYISLKYAYFGQRIVMCNDDIPIILSLFLMYIFGFFSTCRINAIVVLSLTVYGVFAAVNCLIASNDVPLNRELINETRENVTLFNNNILSEIDEYEHHEFNHNYNEYVCAICLDTQNRDDSITFNCTHTYHKECIKQWISIKKKSCPICKAELKVNNPSSRNCIVSV